MSSMDMIITDDQRVRFQLPDTRCGEAEITCQIVDGKLHVRATGMGGILSLQELNCAFAIDIRC